MSTQDWVGMVLAIVIPGSLFIMAYLGRLADDRAWNGGACRECGDWWKHFDTDSHGGRGYVCGCGRYIWISWSVDGG